MASISSILLIDFDAELNNTRRLLERVPIEHANWKPHEKSFALGALASHTATLPTFGLKLLTTDELDLGSMTWPKHEMESAQQLVATLDQQSGELRKALQAASDDDLNRNWTLRFGEQIIATAPRALLYRTMYFNHQIHHRAQLTVYLRELNVPVPGLYGPSADEPFMPK